MAHKQNDGKIIRVAVATNDKSVYPDKFMPLILAIVAFFSIVIFWIAKILTRKIVNPINSIDLSAPEDSNTYEELAPFLKKIKEQNDIMSNQLAKLRKRKNQFEIIAANMQEGLLILDKDRNILHCNKSAKTILGSEIYDNVIGQNVVMVCRNDKFLNAINNAENGTKQDNNSFELNGKVIKIIANPIIISGVKMGLTILLVDISEQSDREKLRREFSANVSHELKTPLSVISGYSELISGGLVKSDDILDIGKKIYDESQHLLSLINDIIQISNLDESGTLQFEPVNLFDYTDTTFRKMLKKAEDNGITMKITADDSGKDITILAIPRFLDEIISNLLENAIKYNRNGGSVSVSITKNNGVGVLEVSDTGIGIANSHKHRIFERFYRVDTSRSGRMNGTGLGLSIVKHSVKIHNAKIKLSSVEGEGTTFTVFFPLQ
jgi:two-component system phosphate regulon sensor histidine kinase PhoR